MKRSIKHFISITVLCILIPSYFYIRVQMLPIFIIDYNAGEEIIDGEQYALHYVYFKNHSYKSVNPIIYPDDYPLDKQIGKTENDMERVYAVKGNKDLIAVKGFMNVPTYFKEMKESD